MNDFQEVTSRALRCLMQLNIGASIGLVAWLTVHWLGGL